MVQMIPCQMENMAAVFNNELILLSGADIPFIEGTCTIHQPTIFEISLIGEEDFFTGCELLRFSKEVLNSEDKSRLSNYNDFHILMSIMNDNGTSLQRNVTCAKQVMILLFPQYNISYEPLEIILSKRDQPEEGGRLTSENFVQFKNLLAQMLCLGKTAEEKYNPQGELAKKIAEKFKQRQKKLAETSGSQKIAIFSRYISILAVGEHKDINSLMQYTVYQLFDEFQRFELREAALTTFKARLAGAKDIKDPEDWMKDLHDEGSEGK